MQGMAVFVAYQGKAARQHAAIGQCRQQLTAMGDACFQPLHRCQQRAPGAFGVGPTGKRLVAESRGQLFTLPAENGEIRAVAPLAGARSKEPAWSPDGKWIAFVSDRSGEENLWLAPAAGGGEPVQLTRIEQRRLAGPVWSPDSKRLAFYDNSLALHVVDVVSRAVSEVARGEYGGVGDFRFSPDGKWLVYMRPENHFVRSLYLYNLESKQATRLTHAPTRDHGPVFDAEGKYLFFLTERSVTPQWDSFDFQMNQDRTTKIYVITLAEGLGVKANVGFLQRPERVVLFIIGALSTWNWESTSPFANRMPQVLWVLAVGSVWTLIHRMYFIWTEFRKLEEPTT